jgi:pyridoxine 5-phosphate synthase
METVRTGVNLEMAAEPAVVAIAAELRPFQVTLVPERREEVTTEGGLAWPTMRPPDGSRAVRSSAERRDPRLALRGSRTPRRSGPARTWGPRPWSFTPASTRMPRGRPGAGSSSASTKRPGSGPLGLAVHAGHGLTYENVIPVAAFRRSRR